MLNIIKSLTSTQRNPRQTPKWQLLVDAMVRRVRVRQSRFMLAQPVNSNLMRFLHSLTSNVNDSLFFTQADDIGRYADYLVTDGDVIRSIYDPGKTGKPVLNTFVENGHSPEFILSTKLDRELIDLPLDGTWEEWEEVVPVTVLYAASPEMLWYLQGDQLPYTKHQPKYTTVSLNLNALLLKWYHWTQHYKGEEIDKIKYFFHDHVISHISYQMLDCWLLHLVNSISEIWWDDEEVELFLAKVKVSEPPFALVPAVDELRQLFGLCAAGNLDIAGLLGCELLNDRSLVAYMYDIDTQHRLPVLRQYEFLRVVRDFPIVNIAVNAMKSNRLGSSKQNRAWILLEKKLNQMQNQNIAGYCRDGLGKSIIVEMLETLSVSISGQ